MSKMISGALDSASKRIIILSILSKGENYGYQIKKRIAKISKCVIEIEESMLYPYLNKLEKDGLLKSEVTKSYKCRIRKYYRITELGREELKREKKRWEILVSLLSKL